MKRRLFILDPAIRDTAGHYLSYARNVANAAGSFEIATWIIAHVDVKTRHTEATPINIVPFFSKHVWDEFEEEDGRAAEFRAATTWMDKSIRELHQRFQFTVDDYLLWPTVTARQVPGIVATFTSREFINIHSEILIRYQAEWYNHPSVIAALQVVERNPCRVVLSTDSELLARELGVLTPLPVAVRPIPHVHDEASGRLLGAPDVSDGPLVISMLGNAREEKGFVLLLQALPLIAAVHDDVVPLRFVIQCNDPDQACQHALNEYSDVPGLDVEWICAPMSVEEYELRVAQSALVLAPYDQLVYRARTSGIGIDALLHGIPIVATAGTWLSRTLPHAAIHELRARSVTGLASAVLEAVARIGELTRAARGAQPSIARTHNAVAFVRQVARMDDGIDEEPSSRRAVVIYPWGDAATGKAGSSSRLHMLVDYLERNGHSVRVIAAGGQDSQIGRHTWVEAHDISTWGQVGWPGLLVSIAEELLAWLGGGHNEIKHIIRYIHWRADRRWRNRLSEAIRWSDDVYLEYAFFADLVGSLATKYHSQTWLTNYDVVHYTLNNIVTKYILQKLELKSNKCIKLRACVTEREKDILVSTRMSAHQIHNVTRTELTAWKDADDPHLIVTQLLGRDSRDVDILMFVGSHYTPNIDAARAIRAMALQTSVGGDQACYVIAGSCLAPERSGRFVALGQIDAVSLYALYSVASIVLNPVQAGSGSAVKMLEAMAHGRCIISTAVGARGHDLHDGVECVIEDDLNAFPARIERWLGSSPEKSAIEFRARLRAQANDFMAVFPKYATADNSQWHGASRRDEAESAKAAVDYAQLLSTPVLASDPVIASFVARRGVHTHDVATRRLREKLATALQSEHSVSPEFLRIFDQIPKRLLIEALIDAVLSVSKHNTKLLQQLLNIIAQDSRKWRDQYSAIVYKELRWITERLRYH